MNILGVLEMKVVVSPIVGSRLIHDYPALAQKIRKKCPKLALQSLMMGIFIYEGMDQPRCRNMGCTKYSLKVFKRNKPR